MKGYKAFNKGLVCKGFQFEVGKTYETDKAECCETGFHLCENPFDVLNYYDLIDSEFCEAEALGEIDRLGDDSKISTTKIKIGAKLSFLGFVKACVDFLKDKNNDSGGWAKLASSGDGAQLASSGDGAKLASSGGGAQLASSGDGAQLASSGGWAKLASSGDGAQLASSGGWAQIELNGEDSVGVSAGYDCRIKGKLGNWITIAEWKMDDKKGRHVPVCVKSAKIDGKKIKADTWYRLKNGKFVEVLTADE